ncbi:MAG: dihydroorotase [Thermoleophilaceae bacterium]|nr:dihydroorotase [Thermoleophilaceae bacterium]
MSSGPPTPIRPLAEMPLPPTPAPQLLYQRGGSDAQLLIRGARLFDPALELDETTDVLVVDGVISAIGTDIKAPDDCEVVDGSGKTLFPAFVDPHVHLRTPGFTYKEDLESGTRAAAAGGFCQVIAMANTNPPVDSVAVLQALQRQAAEDAHIPVAFGATVTRGMRGAELSDMHALAKAGAAVFTDDGVPIADAGVLRRALRYQAVAGLVLALHEEDHTLSAGGSMHEGVVSARLGIGGIPSISESAIIARDALIAEYEGQPIHMQHLSARESVQAVREAKLRGAPVTCEASPHHLALTDAAVGDGSDACFKMNPPLRTEDDRQALIEGLCDGTIDFIATDHAPHAGYEKDEPFEDAPFGVIGLETAFSVIYTDLVLTGDLELALAVDRMICGGEIFGLPRPRIAEGEPANLCLVDLDATWVVGEAGWQSKSSNSCFQGRTLSAVVLMTIAGGQVAYRARSFAIQEVE